MARVLIVFDTRYGATMRLAVEVAEGVKGIEGAEPVTRRVALTRPEAIVHPTPRFEEAQEKFAPIAEVTLQDLAEADAVITGSPTRFGVMTAAMKAMWDSTGPLWEEGTLLGKAGAVFTTTATPHGGNELTLFSLMLPMMHHGMVIVTPGYGHPAFYQAASPYGATFVTGPDAESEPDGASSEAAMYLGRRVAEVATALSGSPVLHEVR